MAGLGVLEVPVFKKPRVALISTGDEIVPIEQRPGPGQVRDINRYTLDALCRRLGAVPVHTDLCPDRFEDLKKAVKTALAEADTIWISGGSSVGTRDLTMKVFETLSGFQLLVHGISISPGKPTIIGLFGTQPVIGLPGHVASALVVAEVFMTRLIRSLQGEIRLSETLERSVEAELSQNIESAGGREDYIRVKLVKHNGALIAEPVFGKSGLISTLVAADGLLRIPMNTEGFYQGQKVRVMMFEHAIGVSE
jgi:molybdopterin molybdotransferase